MRVEVVLPKVDMDMTEGTIAGWHVRDGDVVQQGDRLFDMETNKAVMEVEAPASGRIRNLAAITGEPIAVGTPVAWIDTGDDAAELPWIPPGRSAAPEDAASGEVSARVERVGSAERVTADGVRATPLARSLARTHRVDLESLAGSGPRGRIVGSDVEAALAGKEAEAGDSRVPFSPTRRLVAQRLGESVRTAPHFYMTAQLDMGALMARLEEAARSLGAKPSVTAILVHRIAQVLRDHPMLNASVEGDAARLHDRVHIGVAMDRDGDLVVPVVRDAARPLADVVRELARLRAAVRDRTIVPQELRGATFTISNLGMYGVDAFTAIIDPPQSAILAVGRIVDTPVGRDGRVVLRPVATFTLSSDHRIVDGTAAARFMADLRGSIEDPAPLA